MKKITKLTITLLINIMLIFNTPLYSMAILEEQTPILIIADNGGGATSNVSSLNDIITRSR